jgi:hypothetical protein
VTPDRDHDAAAPEPEVTSVALADVAGDIRRYEILAADDDTGASS